MRAEAARIADPRNEAAQVGRQLNLPPSYLLIHRVTIGSIGVLCQLDAKAPYRLIVERWQPGFAKCDRVRPPSADAGAAPRAEPASGRCRQRAGPSRPLGRWSRPARAGGRRGRERRAAGGGADARSRPSRCGTGGSVSGPCRIS